MSNQWLTSALKTRLGVSRGRPVEKAVLLVLADHADEDGYCWPKVKTIMAHTELGERAVRGALTWLEDEEYLERQASYEPAGGRQTTNIYRLTNLDNPPVIQCPPACSAGGGCTQCRGEGALSAGSTRTPRRNPQTEEQQVVPRVGRQRGKKPRLEVQPDDPTSGAGDEPPALGADPRQRPPAERDRIAAERGKSLRGIAVQMRDTMKDQGYIDPVNVTQLVTMMNRWGLELDVLNQMKNLFCSNPTRYLKGDEVPWVGFIRQRQALLADAGKSIAATADSSRYAANLYKD